MEEQKEKRVLNIELSDEVKRVSITGRNGEEQVVMRQELNEDDLEMVTGGSVFICSYLKPAAIQEAEPESAPLIIPTPNAAKPEDPTITLRPPGLA